MMSSLFELFVAGLRISPDRVAVRYCGGSHDGDSKSVLEVTYSELDSDSTAIAQSLSYLDCRNEIIFASSTTQISTVALTLGILRIPAVFAYMDWNQQESHNLQFLKECGSRFMVLPQKELENITKMDIEYRSMDVINCHCGALVVIELIGVQRKKFDYPGRQLAYAIQTSGTTGKPKTVKVPHRCILPNVEHFRELYKVTEADVVFVASPFTFDPSIVDVFLAFSAGASLLLLSNRLKMVPTELLSLLTANVTMMQVTPSLARRFGSDLLRKSLLGPESNLRILGLGGERCPSVHTLRRWKHPRNATKIFNLYGITEVSSWATIHQVKLSDDHVDGAIPIGDPIRNTELHVLDEDGLIVEDGEGEVFVGGGERVCFIGWEDHSDSRKAPMRATGDLVRVLPGGRMLHVGRLDDQLKRNGKKVSLRQIETAALTLDGIRDGVAIYDSETELLILAVVLKDRWQWKLDLRNQLLASLPSHAAPDHIVAMTSLPITPHGKIDKQVIVARAGRDGDMIENLETLTFDRILDKMQELFQLHMVAPSQSDPAEVTFVAQGGDSLKAVRVAEDVNFWLGIDCLLLVERLLSGTLRDVCAYVETVAQVEAESRYVLSNSREALHISTLVKHHSRTDILSRGTFVQREETRLSEPRIEMNISWRCDTGKCIDASPLVLCTNGKRTVFIGSHSHKFTAVDLDTGEVLWWFLAGDRIESSACASPCRQYVYFGCYDNCVYCLESESGTLQWKFQTGGLVKCSPAFDTRNECVYFGAYDHHIYAVGSKSGNLKWKTEIDAGSVFSSPCIEDSPHQIYFATLGGAVTARCPDSGKAIWKVNLGMPVFSSPTLVPEGMCVGCVDSNFYCFDHLGGLRWTYKTGGPIFSSPCLFWSHRETDDERGTPCVIVGCHDEFLHCVNVDSGNRLWKTKFDSPVYSTPFVHGTNVSSCSTKGTLSILEAESGKIHCEHAFAGETFSSVVVCDDKVVLGCRDNFVYCLDLIVEHDKSVHLNRS